MGFLLRMAFWFSLVMLVLPLGVPEGVSRAVGPVEAFVAARDAVGDLIGLCERQPDVCETGRSAAAVIGVRARETSRLAYAMLDERFGAPAQEVALADTLTTGAVPASALDDDDLALPLTAPRPTASRSTRAATR